MKESNNEQVKDSHGKTWERGLDGYGYCLRCRYRFDPNDSDQIHCPQCGSLWIIEDQR